MTMEIVERNDFNRVALLLHVVAETRQHLPKLKAIHTEAMAELEAINLALTPEVVVKPNPAPAPEATDFGRPEGVPDPQLAPIYPNDLPKAIPSSQVDPSTEPVIERRV